VHPPSSVGAYQFKITYDDVLEIKVGGLNPEGAAQA
jgi:hypothetical protein